MPHQTTAEGVKLGRSMSCAWEIYPDGGYTITCEFCGDEIAYGSLYGSDDVGQMERRCAKHDKRHRHEFD